MVVAAGIDVLVLARLRVAPLGVNPLEEETFNFIGGVEGIAAFLVLFGGKGFEHAADVRGIHRSTLVDDFAEDHDLAGSKKVGGYPVEGAPVNAQAQVAFPLGGKSPYGRAVKGQVV